MSTVVTLLCVYCTYLGADLIAALAGLDVDDFSHGGSELCWLLGAVGLGSVLPQYKK